MATPTDASSLAELLAGFEVEGYRGQMAARPDGYVLCTTCHQESLAQEMQVGGLGRMEGASDPADMLAVVAVVCPRCGTRGTLVLGYGPEAAPDDADVLARLGDVA
ncbi:MAG: hypothetical protein M3144_04755 [Actinomycetota bacterium]|nr:hypothetical protein [Actinomycetota bacterium]